MQILGMTLFGKVAQGEFVTDDANFCHFGSSFLTLFGAATGDTWNRLMHGLMVEPGGGCSEAEGDCGSWLALPFFISYMVTCASQPKPQFEIAEVPPCTISRIASSPLEDGCTYGVEDVCHGVLWKQVVANFVVLNMMIAIIVEQFQLNQQREG